MKTLRLIALIAFQSMLLAESDPILDYRIAQDTLASRERIAQRQERMAYAYAGAIVVAGGFIALGLYCGLRQRNRAA